MGRVTKIRYPDSSILKCNLKGDALGRAWKRSRLKGYPEGARHIDPGQYSGLLVDRFAAGVAIARQDTPNKTCLNKS